MPRPKPPEPLVGRYIRLSDKQMIVFKYLGGAEWLRKLLDKKDPFPKKFYKVNQPVESIYDKPNQTNKSI
jgi:hypothetical protein